MEISDDETTSVAGSTSTTIVEKKKRKKPHFTKRAGHKIKPSYDVLEMIAQRGLLDAPLKVVLLTMTCKGVYTQLMQCHDIWRTLYIRWHGPLNFTKNVPNMQLINVKMPFQPNTIMELKEEEMPVEKQYAFNVGTKKIVALFWGDRCSKCGNKRRGVEAFWYLNERLCSMCISDWFVSDQVLEHEYGITMNLMITPLNTEIPMTFAEAIQDQVYYWSNSAPRTVRANYTTNYLDLRMKNDTTITYFYTPDIKKLVDLALMKKQLRDKKNAVKVIWCRLNPLMQSLKDIHFVQPRNHQRLSDSARSLLYKILRDIDVRFMTVKIDKNTGGTVADKRNKRKSRIWTLVKDGENTKSQCSC